eukprot:gene9800-biopygen8918
MSDMLVYSTCSLNPIENEAVVAACVTGEFHVVAPALSPPPGAFTSWLAGGWVRRGRGTWLGQPTIPAR